MCPFTPVAQAVFAGFVVARTVGKMFPVRFYLVGPTHGWSRSMGAAAMWPTREGAERLADNFPKAFVVSVSLFAPFGEE